MALEQSAPQLLQRAALDLPHPLLGDAEPVAERFQRGGLVREPPGAHDLELAVGQHRQRGTQPVDPPLGVDGVARRPRRAAEPSSMRKSIRSVETAIRRSVSGALSDMSEPESRASITATSSRETPMAVAILLMDVDRRVAAGGLATAGRAGAAG